MGKGVVYIFELCKLRLSGLAISKITVLNTDIKFYLVF